jgi:hypothetical protein
MFAFIFPTILALVLAYLALRYSKLDASRLSGRRREQLMVVVQIICGDCSGDAARPVRTCLDSSGRRCAQCGGTSYALASGLAATARRAMPATSSSTSEFISPTARVQSLEAALVKTDFHSAKVA